MWLMRAFPPPPPPRSVCVTDLRREISIFASRFKHPCVAHVYREAFSSHCWKLVERVGISSRPETHCSSRNSGKIFLSLSHAHCGFRRQVHTYAAFPRRPSPNTYPRIHTSLALYGGFPSHPTTLPRFLSASRVISSSCLSFSLSLSHSYSLVLALTFDLSLTLFPLPCLALLALASHTYPIPAAHAYAHAQAHAHQKQAIV
ncbi:hypothetical protein LY78DRAFT_369907 [Colletotrichum sublineola]|nr:hypothetical protein LY78DRAFT_369907 [Colletotrichum sublineola]